jgi:nucleoid-associated protein YgaU
VTKKLSHEARLGIMVVMVLVFAFGFLVYHKMDMRQRALTQASIAGPGAAATTTPAAARESSQASVEEDPLLASASASEQSPFAQENDSPALPENLSEPAAFADGGLTAPAIAAAAESADPGFSAATDAVPTLADAGAAFDTENSLAGTDVPSVAENELTSSDAPPQFAMTTAEPAGAESSVEEPAAREPAADENAAVVPADMPLVSAETPETVLPMIGSEPDFAGTAVSDSAEFAMTEPAAEAAATPAAEPAVEPGQIPTDTAFDASIASSNTSETSTAGETSVSTEEPMLLAMAEPQDPPAFSGFTPDEPVQRAPAAEPVFGDLPERSEDAVPTGRAAGGFPESAGFNAVARPTARPSRQALRSASGSGSDGRFDLAAFNYQNSPQSNPTSDASDVPTVTVQEGENYTKLSKRVYGTTRYFSALAVFNQHRIPDPRKMRPGMIVLTPDRRLLEEKYPQLFVDSLPRLVEPPGFLLLEDGSAAYRVGDRETLSDISKKHLGRASRWIELYEMNRAVVNDPNRLRPGTILALPDDATEVVIMP